MSNEYAGAIVILIISVLKIFGIEIENTTIAGIVTGVIALWIAIRRHQRGDITIGGFRKLPR
jgi:hypothetical protein